MPRKLNWNKSLENPDANVVHEVVRSYISSQNNIQQNQVIQENTDITNVVNNVSKKVAKHVKSNVPNLSNTNVEDNAEDNVITNVSSSVSSDIQTNIEKDVILNVSTTILEPIISNALTDVVSTVSDEEASVGTTKEAALITVRKKRENFKRDPLSNSVAAMAEWHTRAEQKVYEIMYQETIMHRQRTRYFSYKELSAKTGLRNNRTIINAVNGLQEKKSVDVSPSRRGEKLGREYSIYPPHEILSRRRKIGMKIHSQTKKILNVDIK
jgi:hypothetical protein